MPHSCEPSRHFCIFQFRRGRLYYKTMWFASWQNCNQNMYPLFSSVHTASQFPSKFYVEVKTFDKNSKCWMKWANFANDILDSLGSILRNKPWLILIIKICNSTKCKVGMYSKGTITANWSLLYWTRIQSCTILTLSSVRNMCIVSIRWNNRTHQKLSNCSLLLLVHFTEKMFLMVWYSEVQKFADP